MIIFIYLVNHQLPVSEPEIKIRQNEYWRINEEIVKHKIMQGNSEICEEDQQ